RLERGRGLVVAVDVPKQPAKPVERRRVESSVLLEAVLGTGLEPFEVPAGLGHADHRDVEVATLDHRLQGREDLLVREVSGCAEEDERVGMNAAHHTPPVTAPAFRGDRRTRSAWPTAACPRSPPRRAS